MTSDDVLAKLISVRHHCFTLGVLGRGPFWQSYRWGFRTVNRLYVESRDAREGAKPHTKPVATGRSSVSLGEKNPTNERNGRISARSRPAAAFAAKRHA